MITTDELTDSIEAEIEHIQKTEPYAVNTIKRLSDALRVIDDHVRKLEK